MDTMVVVLIVAGVVGFLLWKNKDRILARVNRPLEAAPTPGPVVQPPPPPTPTISRQLSHFELLVAQGLDLETIMKRLGRALSDEERVYARAHNVPGSAVVEQGPAVGGSGSIADYELPEFTWAAPNSPRIFRNGSVKTLTVPAGYSGSVNLYTGDVAGNEADYFVLTISGPGVEMSGSTPVRYAKVGFPVSPGTYTLSAQADKPIAVSIRFEPA